MVAAADRVSAAVDEWMSVLARRSRMLIENDKDWAAATANGGEAVWLSGWVAAPSHFRTDNCENFSTNGIKQTGQQYIMSDI